MTSNEPACGHQFDNIGHPYQHRRNSKVTIFTGMPNEHTRNATKFSPCMAGGHANSIEWMTDDGAILDNDKVYNKPEHKNTYDHVLGKDPSLEHGSVLGFYRVWICPLIAETSTRRLFIFACANLAFTFFEIATGWLAGSLSLMGDGFHMLLDAGVLFANLFVTVLSKWPANRYFPFGYGRAETIAGFTNALLLLFVSLTMAAEAVDRWANPSLIQTSSVMTVAIIGLLVNLYGLMAFDSAAHLHHGCHAHNYASTGENDIEHHAEKAAHHGHSRNMLFHGMFLHVLADTLGSVIVILSAWIISKTGWLWIDPLCSLFLSVLIIYALWPLLLSSFNVLMQATPEELGHQYETILSEIRALPNVISVPYLKIWQLHHYNYVAMIEILSNIFDPPFNEQIKSRVRHILSSKNIDTICVDIRNV